MRLGEHPGQPDHEQAKPTRQSRAGSAESTVYSGDDDVSAQDVSDLLMKADWKKLQIQLLDYAQFKVGRLHWRTGNSVLPRGLSAEDLVIDAIQKTFEGSRKWNPETHPDLLGFLKGVVDSDVYHLVHSEEHRLRSSTPADEVLETRGTGGRNQSGRVIGGAKGSSLSEDDYVTKNEHQLTPEEAFLSASGDGDGNFESYFQGLLAEFGDDPEVRKVLLSYADQSERGGSIKPATVAEETGLDIEAVRNAIKRLRRKVRKGTSLQ